MILKGCLKVSHLLCPCVCCVRKAPFEVRIMSSVPVELVPLPEVKALVLPGEWADASAGGCDMHPTWRKNPRFLLELHQANKVK